jgi:uncharacterized protein
MNFTFKDLRDVSIAHTLFPQTTLFDAIKKLGFIQADPIRSPARAQDLILRLRVKNYKVGDLEKNYSDLGIEEDFLYAYGFITRELRHYLYPRKIALTQLEKNILRTAQQQNYPINSKDLERLFGREKVINAWGGQSLTIKVALDNLHHAGFLRISGRDKGRRIYTVTGNVEQKNTVEERLQKLVLAIVHMLYPVTERTLQESLVHIRKYIGNNTKQSIDRLVKSGMLERHTVDHVRYIWPADAMKEAISSEMTTVKIVAPFDPLVWDRRRFQHLWGWPYRFEAYTPRSKRVRGYYAMPLMWRNHMIGWVNITVQRRNMVVDTGYISGPPPDPQFKLELQKELNHMEYFLNLNV